MQGKREIQQLLASSGARPNRRLGQHFLIDLNLLRIIINTAEITDKDTVIEVGCGTGSLTEAMAEKAGKLIAVEYDPVLAGITEERLANFANVKILNCDILNSKRTFNQAVLNALNSTEKEAGGRFLLVANLPYHVASPVIVNLVTGPILADAMYITVQKEVAERMVAQPNSPAYGPMGILLAAAGHTHIERILNPTVFWPKPQVDSAFVKFARNSGKFEHIKDFTVLADVVNLFMGHRRKMIKACTKLAEEQFHPICPWPEIFSSCSIDPALRPEQLSVEQYISLANYCRKS